MLLQTSLEKTVSKTSPTHIHHIHESTTVSSQPSCCAQGFQRVAIGLSRCQGSPPQGFSFHTLPLVLSALDFLISKKGLTIGRNHLNHKESYRNTTPFGSSVIIEIGNLLKPGWCLLGHPEQNQINSNKQFGMYFVVYFSVIISYSSIPGSGLLPSSMTPTSCVLVAHEPSHSWHSRAKLSRDLHWRLSPVYGKIGRVTSKQMGLNIQTHKSGVYFETS